jgi:serine protease Do
MIVRVRLGRFPGVAALMATARDATRIPTLGLTVHDAGGPAKGVTVAEVSSGSAAAEKGIAVGDRITDVNGSAVTSSGDMKRLIQEAHDKRRRAVLVEVVREGERRFVALPFKQ